jgi:hypothetical protein
MAAIIQMPRIDAIEAAEIEAAVAAMIKDQTDTPASEPAL